jgi:hypothetical protein
VFHRLGQAKFDNGGSVFSLSQFFPQPQLPQKMKLASKVVEIDSKIMYIITHLLKSLGQNCAEKIFNFEIKMFK